MHIEGREGQCLASPFLKMEKIPLILGRNTLTVSICRLNVSFEMHFLQHLGDKMFMQTQPPEVFCKKRCS